LLNIEIPSVKTDEENPAEEAKNRENNNNQNAEFTPQGTATSPSEVLKSFKQKRQQQEEQNKPTEIQIVAPAPEPETPKAPVPVPMAVPESLQ
jgi:hypothetical protein